VFPSAIFLLSPLAPACRKMGTCVSVVAIRKPAHPAKILSQPFVPLFASPLGTFPFSPPSEFQRRDLQCLGYHELFDRSPLPCWSGWISIFRSGFGFPPLSGNLLQRYEPPGPLIAYWASRKPRISGIPFFFRTSCQHGPFPEPPRSFPPSQIPNVVPLPRAVQMPGQNRLATAALLRALLYLFAHPASGVFEDYVKLPPSILFFFGSIVSFEAWFFFPFSSDFSVRFVRSRPFALWRSLDGSAGVFRNSAFR